MRDPEGYADLSDYAPIGDGRTIALVALDGRIDWFPLPAMDSAPAFAALLDSSTGGHLALQPLEEFTSERSYVEGTNVLTTTFTTPSGRVRVTDSLNTGVAGRLPWTELARRIDGLEGEVRMRGAVSPGTCFGTASAWRESTVHGEVIRLDGLTLAVRVLGEEAMAGDDVDFLCTKGSRHLLGLVATEGEPLFLQSPEELDRGVDRTIDNWQTWSEEFGYDGPWGDQVRRSALILKQLIAAEQGAVVAAATTSLPENPAGGKNWDYRFAWVRDTAYALTALFRFGLREETHGAISWLLRQARYKTPIPHVMYDLHGEKPEAAREVDLPGWRGIGPVIVGNDAAVQSQLGVFGDLFSVVRLYVDNGNVLDRTTGRSLADVADRACDVWQQKDSGMWELEEEQHYTTSKLGCWQALDHAVHLAEIGQVPGDPARWRGERDRIRSWVEEHCWSETRRAYTWYPGTEQLDASIVLHAISGFDRGDRMSSTLDALAEELAVGPHLYRFSGADKEEGAFVACSFWRVSALHLCGRQDEARALMDELVTKVNDVGMLAEMVDPVSGAFLGNLPQALSHLALMNAAITLAVTS